MLTSRAFPSHSGTMPGSSASVRDVFRSDARQPPADHRGLDHAAGPVVAPLAIDPAAGEGQLIGSAVILAKNFHRPVPRRGPAARAPRAAVFIRLHTNKLHLRR